MLVVNVWHTKAVTASCHEYSTTHSERKTRCFGDHVFRNIFGWTDDYCKKKGTATTAPHMSTFPLVTPPRVKCDAQVHSAASDTRL